MLQIFIKKMSTTDQESKTQIDQDRAQAIIQIRQGIKKSVIKKSFKSFSKMKTATWLREYSKLKKEANRKINEGKTLINEDLKAHFQQYVYDLANVEYDSKKNIAKAQKEFRDHMAHMIDDYSPEEISKVLEKSDIDQTIQDASQLSQDQLKKDEDCLYNNLNTDQGMGSDCMVHAWNAWNRALTQFYMKQQQGPAAINKLCHRGSEVSFVGGGGGGGVGGTVGGGGCGGGEFDFDDERDSLGGQSMGGNDETGNSGYCVAGVDGQEPRWVEGRYDQQALIAALEESSNGDGPEDDTWASLPSPPSPPSFVPSFDPPSPMANLPMPMLPHRPLPVLSRAPPPGLAPSSQWTTL